jgi:hypothetical protein
MSNQRVFLLLGTIVISLACQTLIPTPREGTVISDCPEIVTAVRNIQPTRIPQVLLETGTKQGDEFDTNDYFKVLTHISMQKDYSLDYVYQVDGLGAYPVLYALPDGQAPYTSFSEVPENTQLADFREHLDVEDVEQGYFESVVILIMAGQFYLEWHANYNDTQIVCNREDVNGIISDINAGDFGYKFDISQQTKARAMKNIEPLVELTRNTAKVDVLLFTKWGGFFRRTYTIDRAFPHTIIDVKEDILVPYDCGIMF